MYLYIFGRQPELGLAELEAQVGSNVEPVGSIGALSSTCLPIDTLGGSVKIAQLVDTTAWQPPRALFATAKKIINQMTTNLPEGKIKLGLSMYDIAIAKNELSAGSLSLKNDLKKSGRSVRVVPNLEPALSSAQLIHNGLTGPRGIELIVSRHGQQVIFARTLAVQNITAYAARDQARPKRDARVGMLPPKLAQIMINLASLQPGDTILDPFCGTGVVLQEAALMGYGLQGSDIEPRMIEYSKTNLAWLSDQFHRPFPARLKVADASAEQFKQPIKAIVSEVYLGRALAHDPPANTLKIIRNDCNTIITKFLKNLAPQLRPTTPLCLALPAWHVAGQLTTLPLLDDLEVLGYNWRSFKHVNGRKLIYRRDSQITGRQLVVLTRK